MDTETISRIKYITRKLSWMIPFLLLIFISLFSLPGITLPNRDSSVFQYAGAQMLAGKIPYLDFWDHKGPLIFVVNALGAWIHGGDPSGVWLVELVLLAASLGIAEWVGNQVLGSSWGNLPALLAGIGLVITYKGNLSEEYGIFLQFCILLLFWNSLNHPSWLRIGLMGLLAGVSFLFRPNNIGIAAAIGLTYVCEPWLTHTRPDFRRLFSKVVILVAGFFLALLISALVMLKVGNLGEYLQASILYNVVYADNSILSRLQTIFFGLLVLNLLFLYAGLGFSETFRRGSNLDPLRKQFFFFICTGLIFEMVLQSLSGRLYRHYYTPWLPYLSFLGALGLVSLTKTRWRRRKGFPSLFAALLISQFAVNSIYQIRMTFSPQMRAEYQDVQTVARLIRAETRPEDSIVVWGSESYLYTLTGRSAPTRFFYQYPLIANTAHDAAWTQEFLENLRTAKPRVIIETTANPEFPPLDEAGTLAWGTANQRAITPEFYQTIQYILDHYRKIRVIGNWQIYALR